jgi:hypothetical protein
MNFKFQIRGFRFFGFGRRAPSDARALLPTPSHEPNPARRLEFVAEQREVKRKIRARLQAILGKGRR